MREIFLNKIENFEKEAIISYGNPEDNYNKSKRLIANIIFSQMTVSEKAEILSEALSKIRSFDIRIDYFMIGRMVRGAFLSSSEDDRDTFNASLLSYSLTVGYFDFDRYQAGTKGGFSFAEDDVTEDDIKKIAAFNEGDDIYNFLQKEILSQAIVGKKGHDIVIENKDIIRHLALVFFKRVRDLKIDLNFTEVKRLTDEKLKNRLFFHYELMAVFGNYTIEEMGLGRVEGVEESKEEKVTKESKGRSEGAEESKGEDAEEGIKDLASRSSRPDKGAVSGASGKGPRPDEGAASGTSEDQPLDEKLICILTEEKDPDEKYSEFQSALEHYATVINRQLAVSWVVCTNFILEQIEKIGNENKDKPQLKIKFICSVNDFQGKIIAELKKDSQTRDKISFTDLKKDIKDEYIQDIESRVVNLEGKLLDVIGKEEIKLLDRPVYMVEIARRHSFEQGKLINWLLINQCIDSACEEEKDKNVRKEIKDLFKRAIEKIKKLAAKSFLASLRSPKKAEAESKKAEEIVFMDFVSDAKVGIDSIFNAEEINCSVLYYIFSKGSVLGDQKEGLIEELLEREVLDVGGEYFVKVEHFISEALGANSSEYEQKRLLDFIHDNKILTEDKTIIKKRINRAMVNRLSGLEILVPSFQLKDIVEDLKTKSFATKEDGKQAWGQLIKGKTILYHSFVNQDFEMARIILDQYENSGTDNVIDVKAFVKEMITIDLSLNINMVNKLIYFFMKAERFDLLDLIKEELDLILMRNIQSSDSHESHSRDSESDALALTKDMKAQLQEQLAASAVDFFKSDDFGKINSKSFLYSCFLTNNLEALVILKGKEFDTSVIVDFASTVNPMSALNSLFPFLCFLNRVPGFQDFNMEDKKNLLNDLKKAIFPSKDKSDFPDFDSFSDVSVYREYFDVPSGIETGRGGVERGGRG